MQIVSEWYVPQKILLITLDGEISLANAQVINDTIISKLDEGIAPVHLIIDTRTVKRAPVNIFKLRQKLSYLFDARLGHICLCHTLPVIASIAVVITAFAKVDLHIVNSPAEAIEKLTDVATK